MQDETGLNMDALWERHVADAGRRDAWLRLEVERDVCAKLQELRNRHGDHRTYVDVWVRVAVCSGCTYSESRATEGVMPPADVRGPSWRRDYAALGMSRSEISTTARALKQGSWQPRCHRCGSSIALAEGEDFWLAREPLSSFFGLYSEMTSHIPAWMKRVVREVFGDTCAACGQPADTVDHILALSKGGFTEVPNLQPMCQTCNAAKGASDVDIIEVTLTFPLRPAASDSYEGMLW